MATTLSRTDPYVSSFEAFRQTLGDQDPEWLHSLRKSAIARFESRGFPTLKDEAWKNTNVAPITKTSFHFDPSPDVPRIAGDLIEQFTFGVLKCSQLVFLNGRFAPKLSYLRWLPEGVRVRSLREVLKSDPKAVEPYLGQGSGAEANSFADLNTAFLQDGAFIHVPKGQVVEEPIHLLFASTAEDGPRVSYPRNLIRIDEASQATIIESYVGIDRSTYLTNAMTEIVLGDDVVFDHYKMQRESESAFHVATTNLRQARNTAVSSTSFTLGAALSRNDVSTLFEREGGDLALNGLYVLHGKQHTDHHTFIDHAVPNCASRELYKGILDDRSRGIFYGLIRVQEGAMKTNARQTNRNLLLSEDAFGDSTPGLEIRADDVKCTHASTIGHLDEDAIFYLRSRGIDEAAAESLLTYGFASEVINGVKVAPMRIKLDQLVLSRLPGGEAMKEAL